MRLPQRHGGNLVSSRFTVHDADVVSYHNGAAKGVTTSAAAAVGATTIQLSTAASGIVGLPVAPAQMNRVISGSGIGPRTFVKSMTSGAGHPEPTDHGRGGQRCSAEDRERHRALPM